MNPDVLRVHDVVLAAAEDNATLRHECLDRDRGTALTHSNEMLRDAIDRRTDLGGPQAPNAPESSIPGVAVGAFVDGGKNGRFLNAANFADMSLEDAVKKAATL